MSRSAVTETDLLVRLEALVADALAVTTDGPSARAIDQADLMGRLSVACAGAADDPTEAIAERLGRVETSIENQLKLLPDGLRAAAFEYEVAMVKLCPTPPVMPREITDRVRRAWLHSHGAS